MGTSVQARSQPGPARPYPAGTLLAQLPAPAWVTDQTPVASAAFQLIVINPFNPSLSATDVTASDIAYFDPEYFAAGYNYGAVR